jgi:hypothetical protein
MQYALLIYSSAEAVATAQERAQSSSDGVAADWMEYTRALKTAGALVALLRLQPAETATAVRMRNGELLLTDGPFIETKENLFGLYLIEAPDLDTALDWAARMPHVRHGTVEVRPAQPTPTLDRIASE